MSPAEKLLALAADAGNAQAPTSSRPPEAREEEHPVVLAFRNKKPRTFEIPAASRARIERSRTSANWVSEEEFFARVEAIRASK